MLQTCQRSFSSFGKFNKFTNRVLMVEPTRYFVNEETFLDNKFMNRVKDPVSHSTELALEEFNGLKKALEDAGITVVKFQQMHLESPDSIFPNNWFSTHKNPSFPKGLFTLYPMRAQTRENEKNPQFIDMMKEEHKDFYEVPRIEDPKAPGKALALEGTGSLLFDVENRKVYCNISKRANRNIFKDFIAEFNSFARIPYFPVMYSAVGRDGSPVYHTNVVQAVLDDHIVLCTESIRDTKEQMMVIEEIESETQNVGKSKVIVDITYDETENFCGNMIQLQNEKGERILVMSDRARNNLSSENSRILESNYKVVSADLKMIETIGGGSARCMIGELF